MHSEKDGKRGYTFPVGDFLPMTMTMLNVCGCREPTSTGVKLLVYERILVPANETDSDSDALFFYQNNLLTCFFSLYEFLHWTPL